MSQSSESKQGFDMSKFLNDFKVPGVDFEALLASQQKNIEALTQANKLAFDSMQAVIKLQSEAIREAINEGVTATKELSSSGNTQDKFTRQGEIAKAAFERALQNSNKISEIITKTNTEAFELLNKRFNEAMTEAKTSLQPKK